jgi:hypothetical protein
MTSQENHLCSCFLLGFVSETIVILQVIYLSFKLVIIICPFSKCFLCVKSICKNYYLCLFHEYIWYTVVAYDTSAQCHFNYYKFMFINISIFTFFIMNVLSFFVIF